MKTTTYLVLAIFILLNSCSKNDDPEPTTEELLISGKWFFNKYNGEDINSCERQTYFHFTDANSLIVESFAFNSSSMVCQSGGLIGYSYTINSNNEIITTGGGTILTFQIKSISQTSLVLVRQISSGALIETTFIK
ncbi:lipocalin family protein [Mariniflexile gromovii]|uniref:Lipocalin family protein n=1 Tax=Mariniflexile gromovii TaxID=362523 RepID=A0ABS4BTK2_9FLAO|nr:lipocalin family protein [Mariniflexile gromovii]MBP0903917.1 lipocalin family protein [Mariniflexile gromovii]